MNKLLLVIALIAFHVTAYAAGFRCDTGEIVKEGDTYGEVVLACGKPTVEEQVRGYSDHYEPHQRRYQDRRYYQQGVVYQQGFKTHRRYVQPQYRQHYSTLTRAYYVPAHKGKLIKILEFRDGVLRHIDNGDRVD